MYLRYVIPVLMAVGTATSTAVSGRATVLSAALGTFATVSFFLGERYCLARSSFVRPQLLELCVYTLYVIIWLFSLGVSHLTYAMSETDVACKTAAYLCITLYASAKVSCYAFLAEKVHVVTAPAVAHCKDRTWRLNVLLIVPYLAVFGAMIRWPIAELHPAEAGSTRCHIGIELKASLPLAGYDVLYTAFMTWMFLRPVLRLAKEKKAHTAGKIDSPQEFIVAVKTFFAAVVTVLVSCANITSLAVLHKGYRADACLTVCLIDLFLNMLVVDYMADVMRQMDRTATMAVDIAEAVVSMDLERLSALNQLENPTRIQLAFVKIVQQLVEYRRYLPDAITGESPETEEPSVGSPSFTDFSPPNAVTYQQLVADAPPNRTSISYRVADVTVLVVKVQPADTQPQALAETLQWALDIILTVVREHRGVVAQWSGCSVVCHWGARKYIAGRSQAALDAALQIMHRLHGTYAARVSMGIASGETLCGTFGNNDLRSFALIGRPYDMAHTLQLVSEMDSLPVLVDPRVAQTCQFTHLLRLVDCIETPTGSINVHQLIGATRPGDEVDSEWMYQLSRPTRAAEGGADTEYLARWNSAARDFFSGRLALAAAQFDSLHCSPRPDPALERLMRLAAATNGGTYRRRLLDSGDVRFPASASPAHV